MDKNDFESKIVKRAKKEVYKLIITDLYGLSHIEESNLRNGIKNLIDKYIGLVNIN